MFKSYCTVDLLPLGSYDERILFPYDLALGNRLLRDETFPFFPIKIFDLDGCRPSGDVETFDECGLRKVQAPAPGGASGRFECLFVRGDRPSSNFSGFVADVFRSQSTRGSRKVGGYGALLRRARDVRS